MRLCFVLGLLACGGTTVQVDPTTLFDGEGLEAARREAPDLVAQAERAAEDAQRAERAGDTEAAQDHATRARLLYEAAVVEAERAQADRRRLEVTHETEEATQAAVRADEQRAAIEVREQRANAAEVAREQMERAFAQAEQDETRRLRRRSTEVDRARTEAAAALRERARLVLSAARALGAEDAAIATVEIRASGNPIEQILAANRAHAQALEVLGEARRAHPVDDASRDALLAAVRERSFETRLEPRGVIVEGVTAARTNVLAELVSAHPHGPVEVRGRGAARIASGLTRAGAAEERVQSHPAQSDLEVVFVGYGNTDAAPRVP